MPESHATAYSIDPSVSARFAPVLAALKTAAARILRIPDLASARPGFRPTDGTAALVLSMMPPLTAAHEQAASALSRELAVPVVTEEATPLEQLAFNAAAGRGTLRSAMRTLLEPTAVAFDLPRRGQYEPPANLKLEPVEEQMTLTIATSPDAGWPTLRAFLQVPVRSDMHVAIYQFTAPHVYKQLRATMLADEDSELTMTLHPTAEPIPDGGTKSDDTYGPDILRKLHNALGPRFRHAKTAIGESGEFAYSYHIKVITADRERFWLSSGNLQSSNQPPFDPINHASELPSGYQRLYNREHHVVIDNPTLAGVFTDFIQYDFERAAGEAESFAAAAVAPPDLVITEPATAESFAPARYFEPLTLSGKIRVEPLLTPDNYAGAVLKLIRSAKHRILLQNQYINLSKDEDFEDFRAVILALRDKAKADDIDVRIICRDLMTQQNLDLLLALDFPRETFRFMTNTHTKLIVVDDDRVLIGSHNWSNAGVVANRDASLIIHHPEAVDFCAEIFEHDWAYRATAKPKRTQPRVARAGERPRADSFVVPWATVYDETPPLPSTAASLVRPPAPPPAGTPVPAPADHESATPAVPFGGPAASGGPDVFANGIDAVTGRTRGPLAVAALADYLHDHPESLPHEVKTNVRAARHRSFGWLDAVNPNDLRQCGWGIVVPESARDERERLVGKLLDHRRATVPKELFKVLTYRPGTDVRTWLRNQGVTFGSPTPRLVPFHLMLVASPEEIGFEFQYLLDLEYSVGRLHFDDPVDYAAYCEAVVRTETSGGTRQRKVLWVAPKFDAATTISHDTLIAPLIEGDDNAPAAALTAGYAEVSLRNGQATQAAAIAALRDEKPAFLFAASHGAFYPLDHPEQTQRQGGIYTDDRRNKDGRPLQSNEFIGAEHVRDMDVSGMVAFLFACYGAGTPQFDDFPRYLGKSPDTIAPKPFVAALPQALLARGALAVVAHVERAWSYSIEGNRRGGRLGPFRNMISRILAGKCVGNATRDLSDRSAILSAELGDLNQFGRTPADDLTLVDFWTERNDARGYVLLGDPATQLAGVR